MSTINPFKSKVGANPFASKTGGTNPFASKTTNPFASKATAKEEVQVEKKEAPVKPEVKEDVQRPVKAQENTKNTEEPKDTGSVLLNRANPFKKNISTDKEEVNQEIKNVKDDSIIDITANAEQKEDKKENSAVEEKVKTDTKEEVKQEVKAEEKTTKKKTNAKPKQKATSEEKAPAKTVETTKNPTTTISFEEAVLGVKSNFVSKDWETLVSETTDKMNKIEISSEMNSMGIKATIESLNEVRDSVWKVTCEHKTLYENLSAKEPAGLIERVKIAGSVGSNTEERKQSGLRAVMNYKPNGAEVVNLLELLDETRSRYNYLNALTEAIKYKTNVLITMLAALKQER